MRIVAASVAVALCLLAACGWVRPKPSVEPDPFGPHVVESRRLRSVMKQLLAMIPEDPDAVAPPTADPAKVRHEVREVSLSLAAQADRIEAALMRRELPASQRNEFYALADALRRQANGLAGEAATLPADQLQPRFDAVLATCHACHDRFRAPRDG